MALIKCPHCGESISDQAAKCPKCNKRVVPKNKRLFVRAGIIVTAVVVLALGGFGISELWKQHIQKQIDRLVSEGSRSITAGDIGSARDYFSQLEEYGYDEQDLSDEFQALLLEKLDEVYPSLNFPIIYTYYDALDDIGYDTSVIREAAEYDQGIYTDALDVYKGLQDVNNKLHNNDYSTLSALMYRYDSIIDKAATLEINKNSKIGTYLNDVTSDFWYDSYKSVYYHTNIDLDYGLTSWGHAYIITTYTEPLAAIKFPYDEENIDFHPANESENTE